MHIREAIAKVVQQLNLSHDEMADIMRQIMAGQCCDIQLASFLTAMRMKGESIDEITGATTVIRSLMTPVRFNSDYAVDIVGTGGDGAHLFNVSTASAFVAAAAGVHVAKHGNRCVSSSSGSADLLEKADINLNISPQQVIHCIEEVGIGFMFAPLHHSAMKNIAHVRKTLGIRTLFNILGPLSNPAYVDNLLVGVFSQHLCRPIAEVFKELGNKHVMVVHSEDGLDEISLAGKTYVAELKNGIVKEYSIQPEDVAIQSQSLLGLAVTNTDESFHLICDALGDKKGQYAKKAADMIALNSGAAIYLSGLADSIHKGVNMAKKTIESGKPLKKMHLLAELTYSFVNKH